MADNFAGVAGATIATTLNSVDAIHGKVGTLFMETASQLEFVLTYLMDRLQFTQLDVKVALHPTSSTRKMGLENKLLQLAQACAKEVVMPADIYCCGFAGDRGFSFPELNAAALKDLRDHVCTCEAGYSTSKTCEIGLSLHGGIPHRSILYLVDAASKAIVLSEY